MRILKTTQSNQGIGKHKLFSSTAGVGALVTTKFGFTVLISDINKWPFVIDAHDKIEEIKNLASEDRWYKGAKDGIRRLGIDVIDDERFIHFLREEKGVPNLLSLIDIPHLSLDDHFNTIKEANSQRIQCSSKNALDFAIPASYFPKWLYNSEGRLQTFKDWYREWRRKKGRGWDRYFSPPRNPNKCIGMGKDFGRELEIHEPLIQTNLVLICPNGHLSDIPWPKYIQLKRRQKEEPSNEELKSGKTLFSEQNCCSHPDLRWTESKTKSEGYASVYIECYSCEGKFNLEGINNLSPTCPGHKPWEIFLDPKGKFRDEYELDLSRWESRHTEVCKEDRPGPTSEIGMQVALVTGNNTYFANPFSSIFIPQDLSLGISKDIQEAVAAQRSKYDKINRGKREEGIDEITSAEFASRFISFEKLSDDYSDNLKENPNFIDQVRETFLKGSETLEVVDTYEEYRWQEYSCFLSNKFTPIDENRISFKDVQVPDDLIPYFEKIQRIDNLMVSSILLNFSRVRPAERIVGPDGRIYQSISQNIFSGENVDILCLPAVQSLGEGIFFAFNPAGINEWLSRQSQENSEFIERYEGIVRDRPGDQGSEIRNRVRNLGYKFLLLHIFSHLIMRELEFSCGYPTASLKERLYISDRMSGVLIYTAEGSEGSMGGLIWQTHLDNLHRLIFKALKRAHHCSSDPLCWESEGQGIFGLNLAACFSCGLVSETSCEERNLGLDRRMLIDEEFGYFRQLI